jgi:hypothetical protein
MHNILQPTNSGLFHALLGMRMWRLRKSGMSVSGYHGGQKMSEKHFSKCECKDTQALGTYY